MFTIYKTLIESTKTTSMEDVSTGVLEKDAIHIRMHLNNMCISGYFSIIAIQLWNDTTERAKTSCMVYHVFYLVRMACEIRPTNMVPIWPYIWLQQASWTFYTGMPLHIIITLINMSGWYSLVTLYYPMNITYRLILNDKMIDCILHCSSKSIFQMSLLFFLKDNLKIDWLTYQVLLALFKHVYRLSYQIKINNWDILSFFYLGLRNR